MSLPTPSHNTPAGQADLRRQADWETKAGLAKIKQQADNQKKLHRETLERNIKKLQSSLVHKVAKLDFVKREIIGYKKKKQEAENKDKSLNLEEADSKDKMKTFDQAIAKLETELASVQIEISREEEMDKIAKQSEFAKTQQLMEEKNSELDRFKKELVGKTDLHITNKAKVTKIQDGIRLEESALQQKHSTVTTYENESQKNTTQLKKVQAEMSDLQKQLEIKRQELTVLESHNVTINLKKGKQEIKGSENQLVRLHGELRQLEALSEQSAREVGYLERKIDDLQKQLKIKVEIDRTNKKKLEEFRDEITVKEKSLHQQTLTTASLFKESKVSCTNLALLEAEMSDLQKQLEIKRQELTVLESHNVTINLKKGKQEIKGSEDQLVRLHGELRQLEALSEQSAREVGYLERKIKEGNRSNVSLTMTASAKSTAVQKRSVSLLRDLAVLNKRADDIQAELDKVIRTRVDLEQQSKKVNFSEANISTTVKAFVRVIQTREYEQTKLEQENTTINREIEKLESELRRSK